MRYPFPILSFCYGLVTTVRNMLYDEHMLYVHVPKIPTICVGNLAVGGTGKTPHVEFLVRLLLDNGYHPAVLSRGYKRRTVGFVLADPDSLADRIGDEPRQIKCKFPDVPVAVSEDRYRGIKRICALCPDVDVILLDDAFQHRKVRCGYNILLTPADRLYVDDRLMPAGRLRETQHGAIRANMIVVTKCPSDMQPIMRRVITTNLHPAAFQEVCFSSVRYSCPQPIFPESSAYAAKKVFLLSGIAQPQYLRSYLGEQIAGERIFPDHHAFSSKDLADVFDAFRRSGADCILTTEKDAVRLRDSQLVPAEQQPFFYYIPIEVDFGDDSRFATNILRYLAEQRRLRSKSNQ